MVKLQEAFKAAGRENIFERFIEKAEKLILTSSLFCIVSNIAIVFVLLIIMTMSRWLGVLILSVLLTAIFSVAIPHSWTKYTAENILTRTHRLLFFSAYIASPILAVFATHDLFVRRLAGVTETSADQMQEEKQEELLSVVEQGRMEGVVDREEVEMIENVLELSDTTVEEIMTPRTDMIALNVNEDLPTVLDAISKAGHSRIPVYEDNIDNIIGLIYAKDLLAEIGRDPQNFKLRDKMRKAYFVPETKPLRVLLHEFQNQKLHIAVVLDEYGGTAGIVTIEDILEELVGEIVDEYEETPPESMRKIDETTIEVDARTHIDDLNSEFELKLPEEEDYDTIGGFVFSHLGYIPKAQESFIYENVRFVITAAEARRVNRIRIHKTPTGQDQAQ